MADVTHNRHRDSPAAHATVAGNQAAARGNILMPQVPDDPSSALPSPTLRKVTGLRALRMKGIRAVLVADGDAVLRRCCPRHRPATRRSSKPNPAASRLCRMVCRVPRLARRRRTSLRAGGVDGVVHHARPWGKKKHR